MKLFGNPLSPQNGTRQYKPRSEQEQSLWLGSRRCAAPGCQKESLRSSARAGHGRGEPEEIETGVNGSLSLSSLRRIEHELPSGFTYASFERGARKPHRLGEITRRESDLTFSVVEHQDHIIETDGAAAGLVRVEHNGKREGVRYLEHLVMRELVGVLFVPAAFMPWQALGPSICAPEELRPTQPDSVPPIPCPNA